jgi:hypothetical protein
LATDGAEFAAYPVLAVTLPPHAVCHEVVLCGKALAAGSVRATGCLIHALNILCLHAVDGRGLPIVGDATQAGGADGEVNGRLPLVVELPKVPETRNLPREDGPENATEVCSRLNKYIAIFMYILIYVGILLCDMYIFIFVLVRVALQRRLRSGGGRGSAAAPHAVDSRAAHPTAGVREAARRSRNRGTHRPSTHVCVCAVVCMRVRWCVRVRDLA